MKSRRFVPELRSLQLAAISERLRQSLVAIPGLCLVVAVVLADLTVRIDRATAGDWLPDSYTTTSENARVVLGAIATGTITVVTLVLTLTLVAIQLAAGQLSPRTIANFLGDRFQQATVGVVLGTATYSLLALRAVRVAGDDQIGRDPDLTVLLAVILTMVSLVMLVFSVDRTASRLSVGTLLTDLAEETCALVREKYQSDADSHGDFELPGQVLVPDGAAHWAPEASVSADTSGWVQYIDEDALVEALPEECVARLLHPVGTFVYAGMELVQVRADALDDKAASGIRNSIVIGDQRTMQQDVGYGLTRLSDIGLRALSPGINDPNTAREVVLRLGQVVMAMQECQLPAASMSVDTKTIERIGAPSHDAFAFDAFDQVRQAAVGDAATLRTMGATLSAILSEGERRDLPGATAELQRQQSMVQDALADHGTNAESVPNGLR